MVHRAPYRDGAENPELAHTFIRSAHADGLQVAEGPSNIAARTSRYSPEQDVEKAASDSTTPRPFIYEEPKPQPLIDQYD
ncbi:hypothetical protein C8039_15015 [Halogeometricum sp. wsp3]|nr:hypothetical protein C8039_15015 [Halogeometricum sp. wsp3]